MAHGVISSSLEQLGFRLVGIDIVYCGISSPVLNLLLHVGEKETKPAFGQFVTPPKKNKLEADGCDRCTADVERGFSAQNLVCTNQRSRLTTENQDMLLRMHIQAPKEVKSQAEWHVTEVDRQIGCSQKEKRAGRHKGWFG